MNNLSEFEDNLVVDSQAQSFLLETAKWAKFLAIVGFVITGIIAVTAVFAGSLFSALASLSGPEMAMFPTFGITILYLIIAAVYFFPCLFLFQSSKQLTSAINQQSTTLLTVAFEKLKSFFKFVGICTLVILGLYAIMFLFLVLGGGLAMLGA